MIEKKDNKINDNTMRYLCICLYKFLLKTFTSSSKHYVKYPAM